MKQLLHNCGEHVIAGLGDSVYLSLGDEFCELPIHLTTTSEDATVSTLDGPTKVGGASISNPREVQAVAVTVTSDGQSRNDMVWCAVARYDKSLSLYKVHRAVAGSASDSLALTIEQGMVHKTLKRVSTLCFATVHGSSNNDSINVVVAGDLAGDAWAHAVTSAETTSKDTDEQRDDDKTTRHRRLLLGHTASMLTSVHVVPVQDTATGRQHQLILTSDRDEKIRVSQFPSTYRIEGFLLGHEAFVSSIAVLSSRGLCVSVGGDNTLRLWDLTTYHELATADIAARNGSSESEMARATTPAETTVDSLTPVPTKVAVSTEGSLIAVISDNSTVVNFWRIRSETAVKVGEEPADRNSLALEKCGQFECTGQPLGVSFLKDNTLLLLVREVDYIQAVQVVDRESSSLVVTTVDNHPFCVNARQAALAAAIRMPNELLEKDEHGSLKMQKMNETRSGATIKPWNNSVRKETDKERLRRLRKRRKDDLDAESDDPQLS
jgi:WD40 repeat protein